MSCVAQSCKRCGVMCHYYEGTPVQEYCVTCDAMKKRERKPLSTLVDLNAEIKEAQRAVVNESPWMRLEDWIPTAQPTKLHMTSACLPQLTQNADGSLSYGGIRITVATTVGTSAGTFTLYASPDLKRDECYVFQQPLFAGVDRSAPVQSLMPPKPTDPLDVEYDGIKLRDVLAAHETVTRELEWPRWLQLQRGFTPAQRAAVSAHWSAELRAKIDAAKHKDRNQVTMEHDE